MYNCVYCFEKIYPNGVLNYIIKQPLLCENCNNQLKRLHKSYQIGLYKTFVLFEYNEFFEKLLFQYKENKDTYIIKLFQQQLNKQLKKYNLPIIIPPSNRQDFHPLKYLLKDFEVLDVFQKTKPYKQSHQNSKNRHKIKNIIQLKTTILPQKVIFFDDVITSGNTLNHCINLLKQHNCTVIAIALSLHKKHKNQL